MVLPEVISAPGAGSGGSSLAGAPELNHEPVLESRVPRSQPEADGTGGGVLPSTHPVVAAQGGFSPKCSPMLVPMLPLGRPASPAKPCTSSQRSAGTVSDCGEVADDTQQQGLGRQLLPASSLKRPRQEADAGLEAAAGGDDGEEEQCCDSQTSSQVCSKSHRTSVEASPARRRAAAGKARHMLWGAHEAAAAAGVDSGDEAADSGDDGLEFLLRACEMLDPHQAARPARASSMPTPSKHGSVHSTPKITRTIRHAGTASMDCSPFPAPLMGGGGSYGGGRRPVSRRLLARETAAEVDGGGDYGSDYDGGDVDADYQPSGRPIRASTRAARASARGVAAAAAAAAPGGGAAAGGGVPLAPAAATASSGGGGGGGRWCGEPKALINGPCMNPDCEHPHDSPQWRKGPPQHPVLCNACGTRWLRNGTLKPLVPRRGLRYKNKPKPAAKGRAAAAAAAGAAAGAAAAAAAGAAAGAAAAAAVMLTTAAPAAVPPFVPATVPAPMLQKQLAAVAGLMLQPAHSSDQSEGLSDGDDPSALFSQQASMQLPMPAPLQLQPSMPFMPGMPFNSSMAFGPPAVFGNMHPAAAAAAAAEAFKNAPHMFATTAAAAPLDMFQPMPWGFFSQHPSSQPPPALFQLAPAHQKPAAAAKQQQQQEEEEAAVKQEEQQQHLQADAAMAQEAAAEQQQLLVVRQQRQQAAAAAPAVGVV